MSGPPNRRQAGLHRFSRTLQALARLGRACRKLGPPHRGVAALRAWAAASARERLQLQRRIERQLRPDALPRLIAELERLVGQSRLVESYAFLALASNADMSRSVRPFARYLEAALLVRHGLDRDAATLLAEILSERDARNVLPAQFLERGAAQRALALGRLGEFQTALAELDASPFIRRGSASHHRARFDVLRRFEVREALREWRALEMAGASLSARERLQRIALLLAAGDRQTAEAEVLNLDGTGAADGLAAADALLLRANIQADRGAKEERQAAIAAYFRRHRLSPPAIAVGQPFRIAAIENRPASGRSGAPLVSVIMTCFNAAPTLGFALDSVLAQSHVEIEVLVGDDASTDDTARLLARYAERDRRVHVVRNEKNLGTYVSKNRLIQRAVGDYVTFHDSDDWWHPEHVLEHLKAMRSGGARVSTSHWLRVSSDGRFLQTDLGTVRHLNPASTFCHRSVFGEVGLFDSVRAGADTEFLFRLRARYQGRGFAALSKPLAIGLARSDSLTRSGPSGYDALRSSPARSTYQRAWVAWHRRCIAAGKPLFMPFPLHERCFPAPDALL